MRINVGLAQNKHTFFNVNAVNKGLAKDPINTIKKGNRQDKVEMSPQGKMMNAIENLNKQKEAIREQKTQLVSRTLEDGGDMKTIETQLEMYEDRLKDIDNQIAQIRKEEVQINPEKTEEKKSKKKDENKTEEQVETENLSRIANISDNVKAIDVISSVKDKLQGKINVKKAEEELGSISIDVLESKGLLGASKVDELIDTIQEAIRKGQDEIFDLQDKNFNINMLQGEKLNNIIADLENSANGSNNDENSINKNNPKEDTDNSGVIDGKFEDEKNKEETLIA